jgi:O-antigen biosynthesis protein
MHEPSPPILSLWSATPDVVGARRPEALERTSGIAGDPLAALQRAAQEFPGRDVLLCAASAAWPIDGWSRLWAAWRGAPDAAVLSALDDDLLPAPVGTDDGAMDAACWAWGEHASFAGELLSIRASLWRAGAAVSATTMADGRLIAPAAAHFLPCLWIGGKTAEGLPAQPSWHVALDAITRRVRDASPETIPRLARDRPVVLHLLHGWGGGIARFARDLAIADHARQHLLLVARGDEHYAPFGRYLDLHADLDQPPLRRWSLSAPIADTATADSDTADVLAQVIADWGVGAVLVSSLVGHSLDALRTGLPTAWSAHDAYPFWPLLHDLPVGDADTISDGELNARIRAGLSSFLFPRTDAAHWRALRHATLAALQAGRAIIVWPSESARRRLLMIAPALASLPGRVIELGSAPMPAPAAWQPDARRPLRVLIPGHLANRKGEDLLAELIPLLGPDVQLLALGCGNAAAERLAVHPGLVVQAHYEHDDLPAWTTRLAPDIAMLPSTVPETWSYAYSEMCALGLPTLCATLGALDDRVLASGFGWREAPTGAAFAARLTALAADRPAVAAMRARTRPALPTLDAMAAAWRDALPAEIHEPSAGPAGAVRMAQIAVPVAQARLQTAFADASLQLRQSQQALLDARDAMQGAQARESTLRAELSAASALAQTEQQRLQCELTDVETAAVQSRDKLSQAYLLYERDTRDLARQRDTALHLRDAGDAEIARLLSSRSWRLTRPLRGANRWLARQRTSMRYRLRRLLSFVGRALRSVQTRGLRASWVQLQRRRAQRAQPNETATPQAADESTRFDFLRLPSPAAPVASIVIPAYNQLAMTLACLHALTQSGDQTPFEVIVVDDASPDQSLRRLATLPGLHYYRNTTNLGFIGTCNAGAAHARGEVLVFLNNDTLVQPGWLDALLTTFADHPDTGLAGSKLVYPNGRLQEAGGIVFSDGSAWNYGRFEDPADPRFNFVREADYCSGAAIAIPRPLFDELGGFDTHYAPAYYEDVDLAMRVRAHGLKVRYQPASVVVHLEGGTAGTDLSQSMKAYQVENQKKFLARWKTVLAATHPSPRAVATIERAADHRQRYRVLVIDACTPMPDRDAGSVRMFELMRILVADSCALTFFADNHAFDGHYSTDLQRFGVRALWSPWIGDVPTWLAANGRDFDLIVVSRHYVMAPLLPLLREYAPQARLVFDTVDLHFLREEREAEQSGDGMRRLSAKRTRDGELRLIKRSDVTWVVSDFEKTLLAGLVPDARVEIVSTIQRVFEATPALPGRQDLIFVGGFRHPPNVDAAYWLADEIVPRLRSLRPLVQLHLVGGDAPPELTALGARDGVVFHGHVPDLDALLDGARIGLAPLRFGAGVKGKINHYLSRGLPTVATRCAVEGMHLVDGQDVLVADDTDAFVQAILRLLDDDGLWSSLREAGWANTRRFFSREAAAAAITPLLESLPARY